MAEKREGRADPPPSMTIPTGSAERSLAPRSVPQVMVSSTYTDLKEHRAALIIALHKHKLHANVMEHDDANVAHDVIESSLQMVRDSAGYILLVSQKYGQTPEDSDRNPDKLSITELEFNEAQRLNRPILLFIMGDEHKVTKSDLEPNRTKGKKLKAFCERAKRVSPGGKVHRVYAIFNSLEEFKDKIASSLHELSQLLDPKDRPATNTAVPTANPDLKSIPKAGPRPSTRTGRTSRSKAKTQSPEGSEAVSNQKVSNPDEALQKLRKQAVECFMRSKEAVALLAELLAVTIGETANSQYHKMLSEAVVEQLVNKIPVVTALDTMLKAYIKAVKWEGGRAASPTKCIEDLFYIVVPIIYKPTELREARASVLIGGALIPLPASFKTVAEVIVAGAIGVPMKLSHPSIKTKEPPPGGTLVPEPPEGGLDSTGDQFINHFLDHLADKFVPSGAPRNTQADLLKSIRLCLQNALMAKEIKYHYIYEKVDDKRVSLRRRDIMGRLAQLVPEIAFFEMDQSATSHDHLQIVDMINKVIHTFAGIE